MQDQEGGDVGDGRCAERGCVAAEEGWELGFEALDAGLWLGLGCGAADLRLALFEGFEPGVGAEGLVPEGGEGAWEHGCGGGVVETVRVDVVGLSYDDLGLETED